MEGAGEKSDKFDGLTPVDPSTFFCDHHDK